jgi:hydroxypyruvate reductase
VGAGKASGKMAAGLEKAIGTQVRQLAIEFSGQVNVPDDRVIDCGEVKVVGCRAAGYNFPTEKVVRQTEVITSIVKDLRAGDVCLTLISGGGSALLELPKVPLEDLVAVSKALSHSGADIGCLNTVRQCLSEVKAGGLARMKPSGALIPMIGLIISDVIGDNLAMVSSGPTVMDAPRKNEVAAEILHRYLDQDQIPQSVTTILQQTPISKSKQSAVDNVLVGNNQTAIDAAIATARQAGFEIACPDRAGIDACANVVDIGRQYAQYVASCLRDRKPTALITGGEPTVQLSNSPGTGGRNLQLTAVVLEELLQSGS